MPAIRCIYVCSNEINLEIILKKKKNITEKKVQNDQGILTYIVLCGL